jgi:hypothetical protein
MAVVVRRLRERIGNEAPRIQNGPPQNPKGTTAFGRGQHPTLGPMLAGVLFADRQTRSLQFVLDAFGL